MLFPYPQIISAAHSSVTPRPNSSLPAYVKMTNVFNSVLE